MCGAQLGCEPDPLVGVVRWHADVGHDDVGVPCLDLALQRVEVTAAGLDVYLRCAREHLLQALANDVAVFTEDHADRHLTKHISAWRAERGGVHSQRDTGTPPCRGTWGLNS